MDAPIVIHRIPQKRGFAAMSKEQHAAISAKGGRAVAPEKRTYAKDRNLAAASGRTARERSAAAPVAK